MHRAIAAFLGILLASCVVGVPAVAARPPVLSTAPAKESPFLSAILRHSAKGSRDLLGLPVAPTLPEREIARLADRLRPEVSGAADGREVVDAFRRILNHPPFADVPMVLETPKDGEDELEMDIRNLALLKKLRGAGAPRGGRAPRGKGR